MDDGKPRITNVTADTHFPSGGRPEPGYRVEFVTPSGIRTHVVIPRSSNLPDDVRHAVQTESDLIEQTLLEHGYQPKTGPRRS